MFTFIGLLLDAFANGWDAAIADFAMVLHSGAAIVVWAEWLIEGIVALILIIGGIAENL